MRIAALGVALALGACAQPASNPSLPTTGLTIQPGAQGLDIVPVGQEIGFGRFRPGAEAAVARLLGSSGTPVPCAASGLSGTRWERDGLTMVFDAEGAFVGWQAGEGRRFSGPIQSAGVRCT